MPESARAQACRCVHTRPSLGREGGRQDGGEEGGIDRERGRARAEGYRSTVEHDNAAGFERVICELFYFEKVGGRVVVFLILQSVDVEVVELVE
jgi:hypothetical protein